MAFTVANPNKEVQPQDLPLPSQQGPTKETGASKEVPSDKAVIVLEVGAASHGFQQDLASTVMPAEGASKDKEGTTTSGADNPANQTSKLQIKLKKWVFLCNIIMTFVRDVVPFFFFFWHILMEYAFLPSWICLSYYSLHFYFIRFVILILSSFYFDCPLFIQKRHSLRMLLIGSWNGW